MSAREIIRQNLIRLRTERGLNGEQVAAAIRAAGFSMDRTVVHRIESGERPPFEYVDRYAATFDVTAESLMVRHDDPSSEAASLKEASGGEDNSGPHGGGEE